MKIYSSRKLKRKCRYKCQPGMDLVEPGSAYDSKKLKLYSSRKLK